MCGEILDSSLISTEAIKAQVNVDSLHNCVIDVLESVAIEQNPLSMNLVVSNSCQAFMYLCRVVRKTVDWSVSGAAIVGMLIMVVKDKAAAFDVKMNDYLKDMSG